MRREIFVREREREAMTLREELAVVDQGKQAVERS